jgi:tetratricopeptide (TPR) repeat protein
MDTRLAAADLSWRRLGWAAAEDLLMHRIADANSIRSALGHGDLLLDDRPLLELHAARGRIQGTSGALYEILVSMAKRDVGRGAMLFWLESLALRASGDQDGADVRERLAADLGLRIAIEARLLRQIASAHSEILAGRLDDAGAVFETILVADPNHRDALFGRAGLAIQDEKRDAAIRDFRRILSDSPDDVRAWNELAGVFSRHRDLPAATRAIKAALSANPFDIRTLANAGLIAIDAGDLDRAASFLARIRALSPLGHSAQEVFLRDALGKAENRI